MPSQILTLSKKLSLAEVLIVKLFDKLPNGSLHLEWPDGTEYNFGNGQGTCANIRVTNESFFLKCVMYGDIGFAESYMDGDWHTNSLADVISWFIINLDHNPLLAGKGLKRLTGNFMRILNKVYHYSRKNTLTGARKNISEHYDLGNDFYTLFLDETMTYSSAIFKTPDQSLEEAQVEKYDRLCRQLDLQSTDHLLEIGSGWGGMAEHAVKNYGCRVTTVTISQEQYTYARDRFQRLGISDQVDVRMQDYRMIQGQFDKIVSIEMLEAVGHEFLPVYFKKVGELLKPGGKLGLQVITSRDKRYEEFRKDVDFIQKHIFPGSQTPSLSAIQSAIAKSADLALYDLKDIGLDYGRTLRLWFERFNHHHDQVRKQGMDDRFIRKWNYYLQYCEAAFKLQHITVLQLLYVQPKPL